MSDQQMNAANIMGALVHLLVGKPDRHDEFNDKVQIVVAGGDFSAVQMMQLSGQPGRSRVPLVVIQRYPEAPHLPMIGLAAHHDGKHAVYEECYPWLGPKADRVTLIPSVFWCGSFRFADDLSLIHDSKPPKKNYDAAFDGIIRAYNRFGQLLDEQLDSGAAFPEPTRSRAA